MKKIHIEQHIPFLAELIGQQAACLRFAATPELPSEAYQGDAIVIRSANRLSYDQLLNSSVTFIGSASAGYNHVDIERLAGLNITFANAPGSNAKAVAQYVQDCLVTLEINIPKRIGIVGAGHVGSLVAQQLTMQQHTIVQYDPFVYPDNPLDALFNCDIVLAHPALHNNEPYPSYHLINQDFLQQLTTGTILLNASRGSVVNEQDIFKHSDRLLLVNDVWENEPEINLTLLKQAKIATPHIAGHTWQAKYQASLMIYQALAKQFDWPKEPFPLPDKLQALAKLDQHENLVELSNRMKTELTSDTNVAQKFRKLRSSYLSAHNQLL